MQTTKEKPEKKRSLSFLLNAITRHLAGKCVNQLGSFGVHPSQIPFIMVLHGCDGCSQKEMAEFLEIKPPTVNVSIQRLEKSEIVYRRRDEEDQRIMRVFLTEKGKEIIAEIQDSMSAAERAMFTNFSDAELCLLRRFLEQILKNLDNLPEDSGETKLKKKEGAGK